VNPQVIINVRLTPALGAKAATDEAERANRRTLIVASFRDEKEEGMWISWWMANSPPATRHTNSYSTPYADLSFFTSIKRKWPERIHHINHG